MSTKIIKKYFCDGCGVETNESAFSTMPWCGKPITYAVRQRRLADSDLVMDLCETCQHALAKAIDQMHGVTEEEVDEGVDEE